MQPDRNQTRNVGNINKKIGTNRFRYRLKTREVNNFGIRAGSNHNHTRADFLSLPLYYIIIDLLSFPIYSIGKRLKQFS